MQSKITLILAAAILAVFLFSCDSSPGPVTRQQQAAHEASTEWRGPEKTLPAGTLPANPKKW